MKPTAEQLAKFEALLDEAKCPECKGWGILSTVSARDVSKRISYPCPFCKGTGQKPGYEIALIDPNAELPKCSVEYNPLACGEDDDTDNCYRGGWDDAQQIMLNDGWQRVVKRL